MTLLQKAKILTYATLNKKAIDPVILNLKELSSVADFFVIVSGSTEIQVYAIYQEIERICKEEKIKLIHVEGSQGAKWILVDTGGVVVHIFRQSEREYYDLESLWHHAKRVPLPKI
jgi:ribosome-associated protein